MNDLDQMRALRQDVDADPAALARARNRLLERTAGSQGRRYYSRRAFVVTGAVAATAVGAVVVAGLPVFDDTPAGAPPASAADVLNEAARNAGKAPTVKARGDQYIYTRTHGWGGMGIYYSSKKVPEGTPHEVDRIAYVSQQSVHETWRPVGHKADTLIVRTVDGIKRKPLRPSDVQYLKEAGANLNRPPDTYVYPDPRDANNPRFKPGPPIPGEDLSDPYAYPTRKNLATLPTDADKLLARVRMQASKGGDRGDGQAWVVITNLFRDADLLIGPDLRAALFRAAAKIPGIERWASVNFDGQRGIAIGERKAKDGVRTEMIVDPASSRIIGERSVQVSAMPPPKPGEVTNGDIPVGTLLGWTATRSIVVDRPWQTTPAR